jgi:ABC-type iron transport system FetAB ATPase subunit
MSEKSLLTIVEQLDLLPDNILLDIARNESASQEWRKAAVKFLRKKGSKKLQHPELLWIVHEIEKEEQAEKDVIAVVEAATEQEFALDDE